MLLSFGIHSLFKSDLFWTTVKNSFLCTESAFHLGLLTNGWLLRVVGTFLMLEVHHLLHLKAAYLGWSEVILRRIHSLIFQNTYAKMCTTSDVAFAVSAVSNFLTYLGTTWEWQLISADLFMIHSCGRESFQFIRVQQLAVLHSYFML